MQKDWKSCKYSVPTCLFHKHILFRVNTIIFKIRFSSIKKVCFKNTWINYKKFPRKWNFFPKEKQILSNQLGIKTESCLFQWASHNLAWAKQPAQCFLLQVRYIRVLARQAKSVFLKKVKKRQTKSVFLF